MEWKNWQYSILFGGIFSAVYLFLHLLMFLFGLFINNSGGGEAAALLSLFTYLITSFPVIILLKSMGLNFSNLALVIMSGAIFYFLIGALIGGIIGKVRLKKESVSSK